MELGGATGPKVNPAVERTKDTRAAPGDDLSEARFTDPRDECPRPEYWTSQDIESTELEVCDGVYGLVRMLQPDYVIETGTHRGFVAQKIGEALRDNGHGRLDTIEIEPEFHREATERTAGLPVTCHLGDSLKFKPDAPIDLVWFDSGPGTMRFQEFFNFTPFMTRRTIAAFHDSGTHHEIVRRGCLELNKKNRLVPVFLPTPRGLAICQVVK